MLHPRAPQVGAVLVNLNPSYRAAELEHVLHLCQVETLVMAAGSKGVDHLAIVERLLTEGRLPRLRHRVLLPQGGGGDDGRGGAHGGSRHGALLSWEALRCAGEAEGASGRRLAAALNLRKAELRPEQCANIQFTSG